MICVNTDGICAICKHQIASTPGIWKMNIRQHYKVLQLGVMTILLTSPTQLTYAPTAGIFG